MLYWSLAQQLGFYIYFYLNFELLCKIFLFRKFYLPLFLLVIIKFCLLICVCGGSRTRAVGLFLFPFPTLGWVFVGVWFFGISLGCLVGQDSLAYSLGALFENSLRAKNCPPKTLTHRRLYSLMRNINSLSSRILCSTICTHL